MEKGSGDETPKNLNPNYRWLSALFSSAFFATLCWAVITTAVIVWPQASTSYPPAEYAARCLGVMVLAPLGLLSFILIFAPWFVERARVQAALELKARVLAAPNSRSHH